ncbi:MAG: MoaD/ThiS family protein [Gemmatimonadota bacterium]|nr:MoaD/ThiS family protein [Gemmatimonadota bacterium]
MPHVRLTKHLLRFFPGLKTHLTIDWQTVAEVLAALDAQYPGLTGYVKSERGALRKHGNIFVGKERVKDRHSLSDPVKEEDQIHIFQALSGG